MRPFTSSPIVVVAALLLGASALPVAPAPLAAQASGYDLVIANGRVIDPETGLDAVRWVGVAR